MHNEKLRPCAGRSILWMTSIAIALLLASVSTHAQTSSGSGSRVALDEITVTARKREESAQSAPLSVSAFSADALQERNVQSAADITNFVPNVQFDGVASESGGGASSQIAIRGIGQTDYVITVEPAVGIYLDGVYIGKSIGSLLDTIDIDRLEVLRGPQGTLFGKNTIGGAVQLVSKRPGDEFAAYLDVVTGTDSRIDVKGVASGPISNALRARASVASQKRDGFVSRVRPDGTDTGVRQGDYDRLSGRLVLEADLSENLLGTLSFDVTKIRENSPGQILVEANEAGGFSSAFNAGVPGGVCLPSAGASRFSNPACYNSQYIRPLDSYETTNSGPNQSDTDVFGASLNLDWSLDPVDIKSITAWREVEVEVAQDLTASPSYLNFIGQSIDTEQFSQEFQFSGNLLSDQIFYVAGLYYLKEEGTQLFPVQLTLAQFLTGGAVDNDSTAVFGQLIYDVNDRFSITGGLRFTDETRRFNPDGQVIQSYNYLATDPVPGFTNVVAGAFGPPGTPLFPPGWYERDETSTTPMLSLNYQITPDVLVYGSYSEGFKGGGFTLRYFPPVIPAPGTDPDDLVSYAGSETAKSFEIGLKSELLDRRLRLNVAAFFTDYEDIQITFNIDPDGPGPIGNFVPVLANAASADISGIEIEASAAFTDWLRIDGSLGFVDAEYDSFSEQALANFPGVENFEIPNTPEFTLNVGITATLLDIASGLATLRVDYSHRGEQFKEFANAQSLFQTDYDLLGASLTYRTTDEHWEVSLGGTNLTDEAYIVSGVANTGIGYAQAVVSRPREWFLQLRYNF